MYASIKPNAAGYKTCVTCKIEKHVDEFYPSSSIKSGYRSECILCTKAKSKKYPKSKEQIRRTRLKHSYGITLEEYNKMFIEQGGVCDICKNPQTVQNFKGITSSLAVDHDHNTGKIRGLLCSNCNTGIGFFEEDEKRILKVLEYLRKHKDLEMS